MPQGNGEYTPGRVFGRWVGNKLTGGRVKTRKEKDQEEARDLAQILATAGGHRNPQVSSSMALPGGNAITTGQDVPGRAASPDTYRQLRTANALAQQDPRLAKELLKQRVAQGLQPQAQNETLQIAEYLKNNPEEWDAVSLASGHKVDPLAAVASDPSATGPRESYAWLEEAKDKTTKGEGAANRTSKEKIAAADRASRERIAKLKTDLEAETNRLANAVDPLAVSKEIIATPAFVDAMANLSSGRMASAFETVKLMGQVLSDSFFNEYYSQPVYRETPESLPERGSVWRRARAAAVGLNDDISRLDAQVKQITSRAGLDGIAYFKGNTNNKEVDLAVVSQAIYGEGIGPAKARSNFLSDMEAGLDRLDAEIEMIEKIDEVRPGSLVPTQKAWIAQYKAQREAMRARIEEYR